MHLQCTPTSSSHCAAPAIPSGRRRVPCNCKHFRCALCTTSQLPPASCSNTAHPWGHAESRMEITTLQEPYGALRNPAESRGVPSPRARLQEQRGTARQHRITKAPLGSVRRNAPSAPHQVMGILCLGSKEAFQQTSHLPHPSASPCKTSHQGGNRLKIHFDSAALLTSGKRNEKGEPSCWALQ